MSFFGLLGHVTKIELNDELTDVSAEVGWRTDWRSLRSENISSEDGAGERDEGAGDGEGEGWRTSGTSEG